MNRGITIVEGLVHFCSTLGVRVMGELVCCSSCSAHNYTLVHQFLQVRICFDTVPSAIERYSGGHTYSGC